MTDQIAEIRAEIAKVEDRLRTWDPLGRCEDAHLLGVLQRKLREAQEREGK